MRKWTVCLLILAVLMLAVTAIAEEPQREVITSGDWRYVVLDDGTVEINYYIGHEETLRIPDRVDGISVTRIGDYAFSRRESLTSVTIPDGITSIGDHAFSGCINLTDITIPNSVITMGANPLVSCEKLTDIHISNDHPYLAVIDGVLFSKPDKRLVCYPNAKFDFLYEVPEGTLVIGENAFFAPQYLFSIKLPDSLKSIGDYAFERSFLSSITIPDSVEIIGANPFNLCEQLKNIQVSLEHSYLAVIDGVLFSKPDKRLVCYPCGKTNSTYQIPKGIVTIGDNAFDSSKNLTNITISDSVKKISDSAFIFCENLSAITIPDSVTTLGQSAFRNCINLKNITLSNNITMIEILTFENCDSLTKVEIPDGIKSIDDIAFADCDNLISIKIPDSVTYIGFDPFYECNNLIITVPRNSYAAQYCKENNLNYTYPDANDWLTAP